VPLSGSARIRPWRCCEQGEAVGSPAFDDPIGCLTDRPFAADDLLALVAEEIEPRSDLALPGSLELLTEYCALARRLASWSRRHGLIQAAAELEDRARAAEQQAWRVRQHAIRFAM
jgi:hypothetical protein